MTSASKLRSHWLERAYESAGIDASHWDPALGVDANRQTIGRVYDIILDARGTPQREMAGWPANPGV